MSMTTWIIVLACVLMGIVLGVLFAIRCSKKSNYDGSNSSTSTIASQDSNARTPIPLVALGERDDINLEQCFRTAIAARDLPHCDNLPIILHSEIYLLEVIGEGTFGRVWSALRRNNDVAVKEFVFAQTAVSGGTKDVEHFVTGILGEACVMALLKHPNILTLYGVVITSQALWIVSELCGHGSLRMVLNNASFPLSYLQKLSICLDVADGMLYLHQRKAPIIHRDLKSHNIFLVETSAGKLIAKIGDWGSARVISSNVKFLTQGVGTACWLSPEAIKFAEYSKASDVYAFAIVLWEVYTREEVYPGYSGPQIISGVANDGLRPPVPFNCPWEDLMKTCWSHDPAARLQFGQIITTLAEMLSRIPRPDPRIAREESKVESLPSIGVVVEEKEEGGR
jgi:serine/threonine protein kinase